MVQPEPGAEATGAKPGPVDMPQPANGAPPQAQQRQSIMPYNSAEPNGQAASNGGRPRRMAAAAAQAAIAFTAALETGPNISPIDKGEQQAYMRWYEGAGAPEHAQQPANAFAAALDAAAAAPAPQPLAAPDRAIAPAAGPLTGIKRKAPEGDFAAAVAALPPIFPGVPMPLPLGPGAYAAPDHFPSSVSERAKRTPKPSARALASQEPLLPEPHEWRPSGRKSARGTPSDKPTSPQEAGTDVPALIAMASQSASVAAVVAGIELLMPPYKGNNIYAKLLRHAYYAMQLGNFTLRKTAIPQMAQKLWVLAGKAGEAAAHAAAGTVGIDQLPPHLQPYGATAEALAAMHAYEEQEAEPVAERYAGPVRTPHMKTTAVTPAAGAVAAAEGLAAPFISVSSTRGTGSLQKASKVDYAQYDEALVRMAMQGRQLVDVGAGARVQLKTVLKSGLLAGQQIRYQTRGGRVLQTGEVTENGLIRCHCKACGGGGEMSPTDFEIHAGSGDRRPADGIYFEGMEHSMRDLLTLMSADAATPSGGVSISGSARATTAAVGGRLPAGPIDFHMDHCFTCKLGGELLCCDGCTAAYHLECASLSAVPNDTWLCSGCIAEGRTVQRLTPAAYTLGGTGGATPANAGGGRGKGRGTRGGSASGRGRGGGRGSRGGRGGYGPSKAAGRLHMQAPSGQRRIVRRNLNRNKRLFGVGSAAEGGLKDGERLHYMNRGNIILSGFVRIDPGGTSGILCDCCGKVVSCSQFESHAGHAQRRQPYECIFTEEGRSLKVIANSLPDPDGPAAAGGGEGEEEDGGGPGDGGTGGCVLCHDPEFQRGVFGPRTIMLCDQCEREFHVGCLEAAGMEEKLTSIPEGDWFCNKACGKIHGILRSYVVAGQIPVVLGAGGAARSRLPGEETPMSAPMLAAAGKNSGEDVQMVEADAAAGGEAGESAAAAGGAEAIGRPSQQQQVTEEIERGPAVMEGVVGEEDAGPATTTTTKTTRAAASAPSAAPSSSVSAGAAGKGYTWQLLNGRDGKVATTQAIKAAADILQESFDPIIDLSTNTDLLPLMLYARQYGEWDYRGVYTLLLRYHGKPVVAATSRVFGPQVAELPLIATRSSARRQGHARVLVALFMELLSKAGVNRLVLPAAHETVGTWKDGFEFVDMPEQEVDMAKQQLRILVFPGTEVLWKEVQGTVAPIGHHVLQPLPEHDAVVAIRETIQGLVTAVAVAEGEEEPPPPPPPPPLALPPVAAPMAVADGPLPMQLAAPLPSQVVAPSAAAAAGAFSQHLTVPLAAPDGLLVPLQGMVIPGIPAAAAGDVDPLEILINDAVAAGAAAADSSLLTCGVLEEGALPP